MFTKTHHHETTTKGAGEPQPELRLFQPAWPRNQPVFRTDGVHGELTYLQRNAIHNALTASLSLIASVHVATDNEAARTRLHDALARFVIESRGCPKA